MEMVIDKGKLMKRAWNIFRGNNPYSYSFSAALRRSWEVERANIAYAAKKEAEETEKSRQAALQASNQNMDITVRKEYQHAWSVGASAYYANTRPGQYFGD